MTEQIPREHLWFRAYCQRFGKQNHFDRVNQQHPDLIRLLSDRAEVERIARSVTPGRGALVREFRESAFSLLHEPRAKSLPLSVNAIEQFRGDSTPETFLHSILWNIYQGLFRKGQAYNRALRSKADQTQRSVELEKKSGQDEQLFDKARVDTARLARAVAEAAARSPWGAAYYYEKYGLGKTRPKAMSASGFKSTHTLSVHSNAFRTALGQQLGVDLSEVGHPTLGKLLARFDVLAPVERHTFVLEPLANERLAAAVDAAASRSPEGFAFYRERYVNKKPVAAACDALGFSVHTLETHSNRFRTELAAILGLNLSRVRHRKLGEFLALRGLLEPSERRRFLLETIQPERLMAAVESAAQASPLGFDYYHGLYVEKKSGSQVRSALGFGASSTVRHGNRFIATLASELGISFKGINRQYLCKFLAAKGLFEPRKDSR